MNETQDQTMEENGLGLQTDFLPTDNEGVSEQPSEPVETEVAEAPEAYQDPGEVPMAEQEDARIDSDFWNQDDEWKATVIGETPTGNEVQVAKRPEGSGYILQLRKGGELPAAYKGWYTSYDKARDAGRVYLNEVNSAETESS